MYLFLIGVRAPTATSTVSWSMFNMMFTLCKFVPVLVIFINCTIHYVVVTKAEQNVAADSCASCSKEFANLPTYTSAQVEDHSSAETEVWVSYKSGVYNVTNFVYKHPGGFKSIAAAAGGRLEPYWNSLPTHKRQFVYKILESYRIGNLANDDRREIAFDPFAEEQQHRNNNLETITDKPYNGNAHSTDLKSFITPNELHYVRLHLPVPQIEWKNHKLTIKGFGITKSIVLTMNDITTKFAKELLNVTLQCSGNRRAEMNKFKLTHGVPYKHTAISTSTWGGVKLLTVLNLFKVNLSNDRIKFVNFEGADQDMSGQHFGASIPAEIAFDPMSDLLLAFEMNGKPIPPDHGFPIRLIVPGMAGFKSVKFLETISLEDHEVENVWEQRMYRFFSSNYDWDNNDFNSAPSLLYTSVQSAILMPVNGNSIPAIGNNDFIVVRGYAFSGGGNRIRRVDVTIDQGRSWRRAELLQNYENDLQNLQLDRRRKRWTWTMWEIKINLPKMESRVSYDISIACRAFDDQYNSQPNDVRTIWNMMGVLVNHWHNISVTILSS